jgi:hypothetical protein
MSRSLIDRPIPDDVPHYTGSLDASIANENIVCIQFDESTKKWIAINQSTRGGFHIGVGNTEILARRAAAIRALAAIDTLDASIVDTAVRQKNLIEILDRLSDAI